MFNINKKFNFKKLFLTSVCLLFGLALSGVFVWQTLPLKNDKTQSEIVFEQPIQNVNTLTSMFTVCSEEFGKEASLQLTSSSSEVIDKVGYQIEWTVALTETKIPAGTTITFLKYSNSVYIIGFNTDGVDGYEGVATITIDGGYKFETIKAGEKTFSIGSTFTTEQIDPNYSGEISFEITVSEILFNVDFFFRNSNGEYTENSKLNPALSYNVTEPLELLDFPTQVDIDESENEVMREVEWLFKVPKSKSNGNLTQYKYNNVDFTFDSSAPLDAGLYHLYKLTGVGGYGNFIAGEGEGQTWSDPTIVAQFKDSYSFTINNEGLANDGTTYWKSLYEGFDETQKEDLKEKDPFGVKIYGESLDKLTTEGVVPNVAYDNASNFYTREKNADEGAFATSKSASSSYGYMVYNYGFDLTHYIITLEIDECDTLYFTYNSANAENPWSFTTSETKISTEVLKNATMGSFVTYLYESGLALSQSTLPTLTLIPIWEVAKFDVKYNSGTEETPNYVSVNNSDTAITFGTSYSLNPVKNSDITYFCFSQGEGGDLVYIVNDGVWNYSTLTAQDYNVDNNYYIIHVNPVYLSNVYKVSLEAVISAGTYELQNTDFNFATNGTAYEESVFYHSNLMTDYTFVSYSSTAYPLTENYSVVLAGYIEAYNAKVDGDGSEDHEIFKKVYYNTGSLSGGVLTASNPSLYIYLADGQNTARLPEFKHDYAQQIAWNDNADPKLSYVTDSYDKELFEAEIGNVLEDERTGKWYYGEGTNRLTALYIYGLKLYYEAKTPSIEETSFSTLDATWYGAHTPLILSQQPGDDKVVGDKKFKSWMLDIETATAQGYQISVNEIDDNNGYVELTDEDKKVTIKFKYTDGHSVEKVTGKTYYKYYFKVEEITSGSGVFIQVDDQPIVRAHYRADYEFVIDNSSNYWADLGGDESLTGAILNDARVNNSIIKFMANQNNDGKFQANKDVAFYKYSESTFDEIKTSLDGYGATGNKYYIYNYGHYVSNWTISYGTLIWNGTSWSTGNAEISTNDLVDLTFGSVADSMDKYFPTLLGKATINLTPTWSGVTINVQNTEEDDKTVGTVTYAQPYNTLTAGESRDGQTFFCYREDVENSEVYLANSTIWNYVAISTYSHMEDSTYTLNVAPVYLNDVYKVTLNEVYKLEKYKLVNDAFKFATNGEAETYTEDYYNHDGLMKAINKELADASGCPLADDYSTVLGTYIEDYNNSIEGNGEGQDHEILKKVYYSTGSVADNELTATDPTFHIYLAHDKATGDLPMFEHTYANIIAWKDGNNTAYKTSGFDDIRYTGMNYVAELNETIDSAGKWLFIEGKTTAFTTVYVYGLDMFYLNTIGDYKTLEAKWYGENTTLSGAFALEPTEILEGGVFVNWMINADIAAKKIDDGGYGYTVSADATTLTISSEEYKFSVTFVYTEKSEYHNYYYGITAVYGNGIFVQNANNPIVLAKLGRTYDLTINNTNLETTIYWEKADLDVPANDKEQLYGAYSSMGDANGFAKTTFEIADKAEYAYPFQTTSGIENLSFKKKSNITSDMVNSYLADDKYYYVYNYGHYISGWTVYAGRTFIYDLAADGGPKWDEGAGENLIANLDDVTFDELASFLDDYYSAAAETTKITLVPKWEKTCIAVSITRNTALGIESDYYNLSYGEKNQIEIPSRYIENSKSVIALSYGGENDLIAIDENSVWNYYNDTISSKYEYLTGDVYGSGIHYLEVTPVLVDNIYKVNLTNAKIYDENQYRLTDTDYSFNSTSGVYHNTLSNFEITFKSKIDDDYMFKTFEESGVKLADNYINNKLIGYINAYKAGIANGGFDIFRKVYYSTGNVATNESANDTLNVTSTPEFWIYLANDQLTGAMPVFEKEYYPLVLWKNIVHNGDKNVCVAENCENYQQHYIYTTNKFDEEIHRQVVYDGETRKYLWHENSENPKDKEGIWCLKDGKDGTIVTLQACYFRKYYNVEVETLVGTEIERRGYVTIVITDNLHNVDNTVLDVGGNYFVIAEENPTTNRMEMKAYQVSSLAGSITSYSTSQPVVGFIKLYEGCDITISIRDQSKDPTAMASGDYDDMIGYKFSKNINQTITTVGTTNTDVFSASEDGYDYASTEDVVASKGYDGGSTFKISAYFEKIIYSLKFTIDNVKAGEYNIQYNQLFTGYKTGVYELTNMSVDNFYEVSYFAFAGYKLQNDSFVYYNRKITDKLQNFVDGAENEDDRSQVYTLIAEDGNKFDGVWLRENFYNSWFAYPVDEVELGTITIQTEAIEFNYGLKIYDETDPSADANGIIKEIDKGTFSLVDGSGNIEAIGTHLTDSYIDNYTDEENKFYYYKLDDVKYALLSSRMYVPSNMLSTNDNSYTIHDFLLKTKPTTEIVLTSSNLGLFVRNYEDGKIIPVDCRDIYVMLEVRKLYEITMIVKALEYDTNNTIRTTTLTNGNNNSKSITLVNGQPTKEVVSQPPTKIYNFELTSGKYYSEPISSTIKTVYAYTYYDSENTLISEYDTNKYSSVKYTLNAQATNLESNKFKVFENSVITIEYIPKALDIEYIYLLNDIDKTEDEIVFTEQNTNGYIVHSKPVVKENGYYVGDSFEYSLELTNLDYNARITINNDATSSVSTNNEISQIAINHIVNDADMNFGVIQILVEVYPKNNARINVKLALDNPSKADEDDVYGTFSVYVNNELKTDQSGENTKFTDIAFDIVETRNVYVELDLALGYSYVGIKMGTYSVNPIPVGEDGKILMIENFEMSKAGDYVIVIKKDDISAVLDTSNVKTNAFKNSVTINGAKQLNNLYVGANVEFVYEDQNEERLDYFYYTYNDGNNDIEVEISSTTFKITPEILELYETDKLIRFGVKTILRYKFVATVVGQQYLDEEVKLYFKESLDDDFISYNNGDYCDEGTLITFTVKPKGVNKYDIACGGSTYNIINQLDVIVTLNKDYDYPIVITSKKYNVNVSENIYNNLTQVENQTPEKVENNQVNNMNIIGQTTYNAETTLQFTRVAYKQGGLLDRELSRIVIEDNDLDKVIIIEFIGTTYLATIDGVGINLEDYNYRITNISPTSNTVKLTYVTKNNVSITLDYKDYKVISGG